jgi:hypothetical protein
MKKKINLHPPLYPLNNKEKLFLTKVTKSEKKINKNNLPLCSNNLPLQWVFCGQTTYTMCPYECSGKIICIG